MSSQCGFPGNSDLYGLGIRLGVYLQWVTAGAAYALNLRHEASSVFEAYIIFTIAIMIALFSVTLTSQMHVIEIAILLYLYFGGLMSVVYYTANQNPTDRRIWRQFAVVISWFVTGGYSAWFWLHGRETEHFVEDACGTTLFLFAKLGPNQLRTLSKFFASISIIFGLLFSLYMVPLPPNFTEAQGGVYLRLEKIAVLQDMKEYGDDFKFPVENVLAVETTIKKVYDGRMLWTRTPCTNDDATTNKTDSGEELGTTMSRLTRHLPEPLENFVREVNRQFPGPEPFRAMYYRCFEYMREWHENRTHPNTDKAEAQEYLPWLSLLELNELRVRDPEKYRGWQISFTIIHSVISVYTIIAVELMLHWNKVTDVYTIRSVGQLIPFVIGLIGFLKLFLEIRLKIKQSPGSKKRDQKQNPEKEIEP